MTESLKSGKHNVTWLVKIFLLTIVHCLALIFGCIAAFVLSQDTFPNQTLKCAQDICESLEEFLTWMLNRPH